MDAGKSPKRAGFSPTPVGHPPKTTIVPADVTLIDAAGYVAGAVRARQHRGRKLAITEVARILGFSERRVRAFVDGEVKQLLAAELLRIQERQRTEIEDRLRRMDVEAAVLRAKLSRAGE